MEYNLDSENIVLIGPMCAGKTTTGLALSEYTGKDFIPVDLVKWSYFYKNGYSYSKDISIPTLEEIMLYWEPFQVKALKEILNDFTNSIIDLGAGFTYCSDMSFAEETKNILISTSNVVLVTPSNDKQIDLEICNKRLIDERELDSEASELEVNRKIIFDSDTYNLTDIKVQTQNRETEDIVNDIVEQIMRKGK